MWNAVMRHLAEFFRQKICKIFAQNLKKLAKNVTLVFQKKVYFLKIFLWITRMPIWQLCRKSSDKKSKDFRSISGNDFFKIKFPKIVLGSRGLQFWQPHRKSYDARSRICRSISENDEKYMFLKRNKFNQKFLKDT